MYFRSLLGVALCGIGTAVLAVGCVSDPNHVGVTNRNELGPAVGQTIGVGVGAVAGNAAGLVVGTGEGIAVGASKPFDTTTRVVRQWRQETTPDGRVIQVPEDIVVDSYGRPVKRLPAK